MPPCLRDAAFLGSTGPMRLYSSPGEHMGRWREIITSTASGSTCYFPTGAAFMTRLHRRQPRWAVAANSEAQSFRTARHAPFRLTHQPQQDVSMPSGSPLTRKNGPQDALRAGPGREHLAFQA